MGYFLFFLLFERLLADGGAVRDGA